MKKTARLTALLLVFLIILVPFVACSGDTVTTDAETTAAVTEAETTEAETTKEEQTVTETETETETEPATETEDDTPKEKTEPVTNILSWTFDDGFAGKVIGVYCETEPGAEVILRDLSGAVVLREHALDRYFYGRFIPPDDQPTHTVYFYAQAEGKAVSDPSRPVTLRYSENVGANAMIAHDSHVFLNWYRDFYNGNAHIQGNTPEEQNAYMESVKNFMHAQLDIIRQHTGKNTKIIICICTNPAVIYPEVQYGEDEGGWGYYVEETSTTQMAKYMEGDDDIYFLDLRPLLQRNKDRLLFMQADSHWTQIAAFYGYYLAAQKVQKDFPKTKIYTIDRDFDVAIGPTGGDLLNFMGCSGMGVKAATASVFWKSNSMEAPADAPTAYVMGDSYYGAIRDYFDLMFSHVYLNNPESNPPLYDYTLEDLETKQPDYLFYVWTERNIDPSLGMIIGAVNAGNIK